MRDIRVDMTQGEISSEGVRADSVLGGRAFIDWYLSEYVSPRVHPLSGGNALVVSPGLLAGTSMPSSGRLSVGGKSPLTQGIKEANSGGPAGHKLGRLGVRSVVVEGRGEEWQVLVLNGEGATLEPAGDFVGLTNYEATRAIRERYGDQVTSMTVGPAGERLYSNSTVACTDMEGRPTRHAARGGLGAVMGSKHLKAIVIDDSGASARRAVRQQSFNSLVKAVSEEIRDDPFAQGLHALGTAFAVQWEHDNGALVTYNHHSGSFPGVQGINADSILAWIEKHGGTVGHRCMPGCVIACSNVVHDRHGDYLTASLDFETLTLCGSNLGLERLEDVARIDRACDELGLDTIEMGATIGVLTEVGLFEFGDSERVDALLQEVAQDTVLGRVLGNGVETAARVFGISRVPAVKSQAISAHAARASKGWGVTYATSPQGADHTAGAVTADRLSPDLQVARSRWAQITQCALDASGICHFTLMEQSQKRLDMMAASIAALYGIDFSSDDFIALGKRMLLQEKDFNRRAGISDAADSLPEWMKNEPLPPHQVVFDVPQTEIDEFFDLSKATGFVED